ncbi:MAG: hypothetical protein NNA18_11560 [Nitrospira sp.]|nr:hypothetical protein [Nitrospira sp.]
MFAVATETMPSRGSSTLIHRRERLSGCTTSVTVHGAIIIAASDILTQMPSPPFQDFHLAFVLSSPVEVQLGLNYSDTDASPSGSQPVSSPPLNRPTRVAPPDFPAEPLLSTDTMDHSQQPAPPSYATTSLHDSADAAIPRDIKQATAAAPDDSFHQADNNSIETQPVPSIEPAYSIIQESIRLETDFADSLQADSFPSNRGDIVSLDQAQRDKEPPNSSPSHSPNVSGAFDTEDQTISPRLTILLSRLPSHGQLFPTRTTDGSLLRNQTCIFNAYPSLARRRG